MRRIDPERSDAEGPGAPFTGAAQAVVDDLARAAAAGVDGVIWDLNTAGLDPHRQAAALVALAAALES